MGKEETCSATVFGERVQSWRCQRRGVVVSGGKLYCHQHNPDRNTVGPDAASLWAWERWSNKPTCFAIARRTKKQIVAFVRRPPTYGTAYPKTFHTSDEGKAWFSTELAAWKHRVTLQEANVRAAKKELQDARTQLGMAESRVRELESAASHPARILKPDEPPAIGSAHNSSSSLSPDPQ